jgi:hypothetical protein
MKADNLKLCWLDKNNIRTDGCKHLATTKWKNLSLICLGNNMLTKGSNPIGKEGLNHILKIN